MGFTSFQSHNSIQRLLFGILLISFGSKHLQGIYATKKQPQRLIKNLGKLKERPQLHIADRLVLASPKAIPPITNTYTVTTTADTFPTGTPGELRYAIQQSNANPPGAGNINAIEFDISGTGPFTIAPLADLDSISQPVLIDGYSEPGATPNTLHHGDDANLLIVLNGSNYTVGDGSTTGNGLHFVAGSDGSIVRGLVINQWLLAGILIDGSNGSINNISVVGNFIGMDPTGSTQMANQVGVGISGVNLITGAANPNTNMVIGTTAVADRNLLAGSFAFLNFDTYVVFGNAIATIFNFGTSVVNNYIGVDRSGTNALGNMLGGISMNTETNTTIGGTTHAARNIISGATILGLNVQNCDGLIQDNYVGTDITGTRALGNLYGGIEVDGLNPLGLPTATTGCTVINNLISGNAVGLRIGDPVQPGAILNTIQGNLIGTDASGKHPLPNTDYGILLIDEQNTITGNTIKYNVAGGILVYSNVGNSNNITNNVIDANGGNGIQVGLYSTVVGPTNNTIGS